MPFLSLSRATSLPLRLYRSEAKGMLGCHSDEGIRALQQGSVALRQRKTYFAKPPELCQNFYSREQMNDLVILTRSRTCLTLRRRYANILGHSWRHLSALTLFPSLLTSPLSLSFPWTFFAMHSVRRWLLYITCERQGTSGWKWSKFLEVAKTISQELRNQISCHNNSRV